MKQIRCLKWFAIACATLVIAVAAEARSWGLRGFAQDASGNLYTASYYPTSTKLRVSKRSQTNGSPWQLDITPPSGFRFGATHVIRFDGSGNMYIGTYLTNPTTTVSQYAIYKYTTSGSPVASVFYAPIPTGQTGTLAGLVLDSSGNVYLAGTYGTSSTGFIAKYNSSLASGVSRAVSIAGYTSVVDDLVADGSGNVYVSALGRNGSSQVASTVCKWDSSFTVSPVWQQTYTLGANATPAATPGGCLVIDGSSNVTYMGMYADSNYSSQTNIYAVQYTSGGSQNWANQPGLPGMASWWTILDASGDIVVAGTTSSVNYQIAKFNGSTGSVTWSSTRLANSVTPIVCQDASGGYLVVTSQVSGSATVSKVDLFTSGGGYSSTSTYSSGATGQDFGQIVLPSSTAGTFFVFGVGLSGGTYYPLIYRSGTSPWTVYQT